MTSTLKPSQRLFRLLTSNKRQISYIYVYAIFNGLIYLTIPLGVQTIINFLLGGQISASLVILILFVVLGVAMSGWFQIMQISLTENLQQTIFTKASLEFAFRIPRLRLDAVYDEYLPELVNRFFDILSVQKGLSKLLIDFSTASLQGIFGLILLSFYHPLFIVFALVTVLIIYAVIRISGPKGLVTSLKESKAKYEVVHWLEEVARTHNTFKLSGGSEMPMDTTDKLSSEYLHHRKKHFRILKAHYINMVIFKVLVVGGVLILGSLLVINEQINIGQFVASEIIILLVINSVEKLVLSVDTIYDVLTAIEKVGTVTDLPLEKDEGVDLKTSAGDRRKTEGLKVSLSNLSFTYPGGKKPTLTDLTMTIDKGERVCIAGSNGSGKSTLLQLVAGLYDQYEGSITFNDIPLRNINPVSLRRLIGDSIFEEKLFHGTFYENITLGRPEFSLERVKEVVELVGLSSFIDNQEQGYFAEIDAGGKRLPDSTVAKIIIARAIACRPALLLVSETLQILAKEEREKIIKYLMHRKHGWTVILVSSNIDVVKSCDRVIVLDAGRIVENERVKNVGFKKLLYQRMLS